MGLIIGKLYRLLTFSSKQTCIQQNNSVEEHRKMFLNNYLTNITTPSVQGNCDDDVGHIDPDMLLQAIETEELEKFSTVVQIAIDNHVPCNELLLQRESALHQNNSLCYRRNCTTCNNIISEQGGHSTCSLNEEIEKSINTIIENPDKLVEHESKVKTEDNTLEDVTDIEEDDITVKEDIDMVKMQDNINEAGSKVFQTEKKIVIGDNSFDNQLSVITEKTEDDSDSDFDHLLFLKRKRELINSRK